MKKNNKLAKTALGGLAAVAVVGATFAWFTDSVQFDNLFKTGGFGDKIYEEFTPPKDWRPGQEVDKEVYVENTGDIPLVTRVHFSEEWKKDGGGKLENTFGNPAKEAAIKNFVNLDPEQDWKGDNVWQRNGATDAFDGKTYYYFLDVVNPEETTDKLLDSVTMNPDIEVNTQTSKKYYKYNETTKEFEEVTLTDEQIANKEYDKVETKTTTSSTYADATYTLTIYVETVQADYAAIEETWGADLGTNLDAFAEAVGCKKAAE